MGYLGSFEGETTTILNGGDWVRNKNLLGRYHQVRMEMAVDRGPCFAIAQFACSPQKAMKASKISFESIARFLAAALRG